jgi:protein TonB
MQPTYVPANIANYAKIVQAKINKVAYYPPQARDAGWEGNTKMSLNIACDGTLKEVKILQSSGYKILDDAATQAARSQSPYPPFPPQIENQEIWVDVSLVYKK